MKRWLTEFDILSNLSLDEDLTNLTFKHPIYNYEINISKKQSEKHGTPLLSFQIFLDSENFEKAIESSDKFMREFTDLLTYITNSKFSIHKKIRTVDWTPGVSSREIYQYQEVHEFQPPLPILNNSHIETVNSLAENVIDTTVKRALKWFARGISSIYLDDQFQYFWFAIELLAEKNKPAVAVNDKCPKCHEPLFCKKCLNTPTHRPYPKQAIEQLIRNCSKNKSEKLFKEADKVRNGIMHGLDIQTIEEINDLSVVRIVNIIGKIAWVAILREFKFKAYTKLNIIAKNIYSHGKVEGILKMEIPGGTSNPKISDLPTLDFDIIPIVETISPPKRT